MAPTTRSVAISQSPSKSSHVSRKRSQSHAAQPSRKRTKKNDDVGDDDVEDIEEEYEDLNLERAKGGRKGAKKVTQKAKEGANKNYKKQYVMIFCEKKNFIYLFIKCFRARKMSAQRQEEDLEEEAKGKPAKLRPYVVFFYIYFKKKIINYYFNLALPVNWSQMQHLLPLLSI